MRHLYFLVLIFFCITNIFAQDPYFPPLTGDQWETTSLTELGWCEDKTPALYEFLDNSNTKAFIVLKDGKIVIEKYFDEFTLDSVWYWASAGKSLKAFALGIAQEENLLSIDDPTSIYLGEGWTSATKEQESAITLRHQLTMTTGLDEAEDFDCTEPICLDYLADPGTRWFYYNAPYTLLTDVLEEATGQNLNLYQNSRIYSKTGMSGIYVPVGYAKVFFSKPRSMARFGLLVSNNGIWDNTPILNDQNYIQEMLSSSQSLNEAYGYLWWLNGTDTYMLPSTEQVFPGPAITSAPSDLVAAIGKDGQILNIVPSQDLVVVRMGENPGGTFFVPNIYNSDIWDYLNPVICSITSAIDTEADTNDETLEIFPNPAKEEIILQAEGLGVDFVVELYTIDGQGVLSIRDQTRIEIDHLPAGIYFVKLRSEGVLLVSRFVKGE